MDERLEVVAEGLVSALRRDGMEHHGPVQPPPMENALTRNLWVLAPALSWWCWRARSLASSGCWQRPNLVQSHHCCIVVLRVRGDSAAARAFACSLRDWCHSWPTFCTCRFWVRRAILFLCGLVRTRVCSSFFHQKCAVLRQQWPLWDQKILHESRDRGGSEACEGARQCSVKRDPDTRMAAARERVSRLEKVLTALRDFDGVEVESLRAALKRAQKEAQEVPVAVQIRERDAFHRTGKETDRQNRRRAAGPPLANFSATWKNTCIIRMSLHTGRK